jgi:hypothetical protein
MSGLLAAERRRRRTRRRRRALGCYRKAVLVLRWFCDGTRLAQLAADNRIGRSTAYRCLHEGIDALAPAAPGLRGGLLAVRAAGHPHVTVDGTLIRTDRCHAPGPTVRVDRPQRRVDLWWSGKARLPRRQRAGHRRARWLADLDLGRAARPRARHHRTARPPRGPAATGRVDRRGPCGVLADLGYEGERATLTTPIKHRTGGRLSADQRTVNLLHAATRGPAERGNSLLKTTFKALRRVSLCP